MKAHVPLLLLLSILLTASCANQAYDLDKLDKEVTLFENEISVPVGDVGPFTLELALKSEKIGALLGSVLETESDGTILSQRSAEFYRINAYEIAAKTEDLSQPFTFPVGDEDIFPASTLTGLLTGFGFGAVDQKVSVTINNPLAQAYTLGGSSFVFCIDMRSSDTTFRKAVDLKDITVRTSYSGTTKLLEADIPDNILITPYKMGVKDFSINLPADLMSQIRGASTTDFILTSNYTGHICAGNNLNFDLASLIGSISVNFKLPISSYCLKDVQVSLDLQNTLPMEVTLSDIQLLTGEEKPAADPNLEVSPGTLVIKGGSLEQPGVTPITLRIQARSGAIPDITGIQLGLKLGSASGYAATPLSIKQGISVKSASATLRGGITFSGKKNENEQ